jgi:hypothetical protein
MILCGGLFEQAAGGNIVFGSALTLRQHHAELVLRFRIGLRRLRQQV